jgi:tRNA pseudouridine38-40 synthase
MSQSRYFLDFSYLGDAYHGWQRQPNVTSVQQVIEEALFTTIRKETLVFGAGRTDTGVHAKQMIAHFDAELDGNKEKQLVYQLNSYLPRDIAVKHLLKVSNNAHARFDATERSYEYHLCTEKDPFEAHRHYHIRSTLDIELMNQAAQILFEYEDFECFSKTKTDVKTFICKIKHAQWTVKGSHYVFNISADRFLRNMVRAIVGTILKIGLKKQDLNDFRKIIESKNRSEAGLSVPAKGLFLTKIIYPKSIFI